MAWSERTEHLTKHKNKCHATSDPQWFSKVLFENYLKSRGWPGDFVKKEFERMGQAPPKDDRCTYGTEEELMAPKAHGTCERRSDFKFTLWFTLFIDGPAATLRWNVPTDLADKICCFNRHSAEVRFFFVFPEDAIFLLFFSKNSGFWLDQKKHKFLTEVDKSGKEVIFYDSIFQKPIFIAPRNRTWEEFEKESTSHGWPSFRIEESM